MDGRIVVSRDLTPFLGFGDQLRIEMCDAAGRSIFDAIEQTVLRYERG
jgi:fumarylacetoacetate (FAA) hydrolase